MTRPTIIMSLVVLKIKKVRHLFSFSTVNKNMSKLFVTTPETFVDLTNNTDVGTYQWCVDNGGCEKAMCAIMNASLRPGTSYEGADGSGGCPDGGSGCLTEGTDPSDDYELVPCSEVSTDGKLNDWQSASKIKYLDDTKDEFKLTRIGYLTQMGEDAFVVTCDKPATWCEGTRESLVGTVNVNAVKAKCREGSIDHIGYQCNSDDGRKSFYACGTGGWITAGRGDNGFLNATDWEAQFGSANCVAL